MCRNKPDGYSTVSASTRYRGCEEPFNRGFEDRPDLAIRDSCSAIRRFPAEPSRRHAGDLGKFRDAQTRTKTFRTLISWTVPSVGTYYAHPGVVAEDLPARPAINGQAAESGGALWGSERDGAERVRNVEHIRGLGQADDAEAVLTKPIHEPPTNPWSTHGSLVVWFDRVVLATFPNSEVMEPLSIDGVPTVPASEMQGFAETLRRHYQSEETAQKLDERDRSLQMPPRTVADANPQLNGWMAQVALTNAKLEINDDTLRRADSGKTDDGRAEQTKALAVAYKTDAAADAAVNNPVLTEANTGTLTETLKAREKPERVKTQIEKEQDETVKQIQQKAAQAQNSAPAVSDRVARIMVRIDFLAPLVAEFLADKGYTVQLRAFSWFERFWDGTLKVDNDLKKVEVDSKLSDFEIFRRIVDSVVSGGSFKDWKRINYPEKPNSGVFAEISAAPGTPEAARAAIEARERDRHLLYEYMSAAGATPQEIENTGWTFALNDVFGPGGGAEIILFGIGGYAAKGAADAHRLREWNNAIAKLGGIPKAHLTSAARTELYVKQGLADIASREQARQAILLLVDQILKPFAARNPDAKVGVRGSLARGLKFEGGQFDPFDYDVDAFIVSNELAARIPLNTAVHRNLGSLRQYQSAIEAMAKRVKGLPGIRKETFWVRVFSEAEFAAKVGLDERHIIPNGH